MAAKKSRARTTQREAERSLEKLRSSRARLFELETGGAPERPLSVSSAAVIEAHAESVPCPRCDGKHEVVEHAARTIENVRLREVRLRCRQCGTTRCLWFRIQDVLPN